MGRSHPQDLRWRAIFGVWFEELAFSDVAARLSMGPMQVSARWVTMLRADRCSTLRRAQSPIASDLGELPLRAPWRRRRDGRRDGRRRGERRGERRMRSSRRRGGGVRRGGRARGSRRAARGCGSERAAGGGAPRVCRGRAQRGAPAAAVPQRRFCDRGERRLESICRVSRRVHVSLSPAK